MSDEITARLFSIMSDIAESVHKTQQDIAVLKTQQDERKESQERIITELKVAQEKDHKRIENLEQSRDKVSVLWAILGFAPAVIAAICAVITLMKH